jgi:hypothetical protein
MGNGYCAQSCRTWAWTTGRRRRRESASRPEMRAKGMQLAAGDVAVAQPWRGVAWQLSTIRQGQAHTGGLHQVRKSGASSVEHSHAAERGSQISDQISSAWTTRSSCTMSSAGSSLRMQETSYMLSYDPNSVSEEKGRLLPPLRSGPSRYGTGHKYPLGFSIRD